RSAASSCGLRRQYRAKSLDITRGDDDLSLALGRARSIEPARCRGSNAMGEASPSKETVVLVLQGGGGLGAYQAGAYEALEEFDGLPDGVAGISIGAINGAIIAGDPPSARVAKLRRFWEQCSSWLQGDPPLGGTHYRELFNYISAAAVSTVGVPGFFEPRI